MALFVLRALDKPGSAAIRQETRPAHLAYLATLGKAVRVGGPMFAEDGATVIGSMIVYEAPDRATVEHWIAEDPYTTAGLFAETTLTPFRWVVNAPADLV